MFSWLGKFFSSLSLKKKDFYRELNPLDRVYNYFHCTTFCMGAVLGEAVFLLIPTVDEARGVFFAVHLLIYSMVALLSVLCLAELASLMPSTGSTYHYCYYSMGEFIGFLTGWNLVFGQVLNVAQRVMVLQYIVDEHVFDQWLDRTLSIPTYSFFKLMSVGGTINVVSPFLLIPMAVMGTVLVKHSRYIISLFVMLIIVIITFYLIIFPFYIDIYNINTYTKWREMYASSCYIFSGWCFCGYEVLGILGEETIDPTYTIPTSLMVSMRIIIGVSFITALLIPFVWVYGIVDYLWPFRAIMKSIGLVELAWPSMIGQLVGLFCSIYASYFLLIRLTYAMSRDGLIFGVFSKVDRLTKTPLIPSIIMSLILTLVASFVKPGQGMYSASYASLISTHMMTYVCLLYTRYECKTEEEEDIGDRWVLINWPRKKTKPTPITHTISMYLIFIMVMTSYLIVNSAAMLQTYKYNDYVLKRAAMVFIFIFIGSFLCLNRQPQNDRSNLHYTVPSVPLLPMAATMSDLYLVTTQLVRPRTWYALSAWWVIGVIYYFLYSYRSSVERRMRMPGGETWQIMAPHSDPFLGDEEDNRSSKFSIRNRRRQRQKRSVATSRQSSGTS